MTGTWNAVRMVAGAVKLVRVAGVMGVAGVGAMGVAPAFAEPLIDNLAQPTRAVTLLATVEPDRLWAAQSFSTPTRFKLDSIEVLAGNAIDGPEIVGELRVGETPAGALVATFGVPALPALTLEVVTLTPDAAVTLEPGLFYWLVLGPATGGGGSFGWAYAEGNDFDGPGAFHNYAYSGDEGATWDLYGHENPYHVRVNVSDVPGCPADVDDGSGTGTPDGGVTIDDLLYYLDGYGEGLLRADFDDGSGTGTPDGGVTIDDLLYYLGRFEGGC